MMSKELKKKKKQNLIEYYGDKNHYKAKIV